MQKTYGQIIGNKLLTAYINELQCSRITVISIINILRFNNYKHNFLYYIENIIANVLTIIWIYDIIKILKNFTKVKSIILRK